jgi:predicted TIM-barrel fold metal-dependent hydrolase
VTLDFTDVPVIDNHCHPMDPKKTILDPGSLAREFHHGFGDIPKDGVRGRSWGATDELSHHFPYMGVVNTMVRQLSMLLGCAPTLEAVAAERNRQTSKGFAAYARLLYQDAGIVGTLVDSPLPLDDPVLDLFPGKVLRLFHMNTALKTSLEKSESYPELLDDFRGALTRAVREDGFVGVKGHLAEEVGFGVELDPVTGASFSAAKSGNSDAFKGLYLDVFKETLIQCQELGIPMHIHTGMTGGLWNGPLHDADPFLLAPLLRRPEYLRTTVVLLHGGHPWIQHAAALAHVLPHVWVDMGWTTPWTSLRLVEGYRDVIGMTPLSKLMIGSGGHGTPEIAWLAAKTAKISLREVLGDAVRLDLLDQTRAEEVGRKILHDNAARLYGID